MKKDKEWLKEKTRKLRITHEKYGTEYSMGVIGACTLFLLQIDQLDEPEVLIAEREVMKEPKKVVIPAFVAEWIKNHDSFVSAFSIYDEFRMSSEEEKLYDWLKSADNAELFARAWLDGYEVEKEKRYRVNVEGLAILASFYGEVGVYHNSVLDDEDYVKELTEQEIKGYDERFWPFAVPVKEVTE